MTLNFILKLSKRLKEEDLTMQKKGSSNTGKFLFGGFSLFFIVLSFILFKLSFREINIQSNLWMEIKVTYEASKMVSRASARGGYGPQKSYTFLLKMREGQVVSLSDFYFKHFNIDSFKQEVAPGDVLYIIVRKDQLNKKVLQLGGLRKNEKIYFGLEQMKEAEEGSLFILKILFYISLAVTLFWLSLTFTIFNKKEASLSEKLTDKD